MGISRQIAKSKITKNEIFLLVVIVNVHIYRNQHILEDRTPTQKVTPERIC